ncbi:MAG: M24 family metallopeptidase [Christensenellales bacterium]|jgi:Xaa-Pro aminopeptidase
MDRASRLIAQCALADSEAVIIHKPSNMRYLSGYTGEGMLVLSHGVRAIITDFRYTEQVGQQAPGWTCLEISTGIGHADLVGQVLKEHGLTSARYEDDYVTVKGYETLVQKLSGVALTSLNCAPEALRMVKDEDELAQMEKACALSSQAFDYICGVIKPGMTEQQLKLELEYRMLSLGADSVAFSTIVASGPNGSLPHAVPGSRRVEKGDMVTLDFGARVNGYCADMTRTVAVGEPSAKMKEIYAIVLEAQMTCQDALAPGKVCKDIDALARDIIGAAGYGEHFGHGLGHGVGIDIHEEPRLSRVGVELLTPGHVVTVEPGIYLPGIGGVRIENTCVITQSGARSLVDAPRELLVIT